MITFVTDILADEPDILTCVADQELTIHDATDGKELHRVSAPTGGWTHDLLIEQQDEIARRFDRGHALDALVGGAFVGSTEV